MRRVQISLRRGAAALATLALLAAATAAAPPRRNPPQQAPPTVAEVVAALNAAAPGIHSLRAHAEVADYTALVDDTSTSSGMLYFERSATGPLFCLDLTQPTDAAKRLVYRDRTAWLYVPAAKQVQEYKLGQQQEILNGYLLLGLGETGTALTRSFEVRVVGAAELDGVPTVELELTPHDASAGGRITRINLWYDTRTWVAAQEQIWQPGGDYHRVHYTGIERNPRLDPKVFSTDFPGAKVIVPNG